VIQIVTKIELIGTWAMPYHSKKFRQNAFTTFSVIRRTDKQTDRQTGRSENITSFGGGNNTANWKAFRESENLCAAAILNFLERDISYQNQNGRTVKIDEDILNPGRVTDVKINVFSKAAMNERTNEHAGSQYLLVKVIT